MSDEISVKVIRYPDRANLVLAYEDPTSGKRKTKSAGTADEKDAWKAAAKWEEELLSGVHCPPSRVTWADFRKRYEDEKLASLAPGTQRTASNSLDCLERVLDPDKLVRLTASAMSDFQAKLRKAGTRETTIARHLRAVKAALNWGVRMGMLAKRPAIEMPKRAKGAKLMKGRPITLEEFERMLDKVPAVLTEKPNKRRKEPEPPASGVVESWRFYLAGLWLSGLRLAESLELTWDRDDKLRVDLDGKRPMLRIPAALEKGNQDRLLPVAPEFAELLLRTHVLDRSGHVFTPEPVRATRSQRLSEEQVGKIVAAIGRAAVVKVDTDPTTGKVKYASAHDLRRSFGARWAVRVMPQTLMELMRHESIETTLRYYVGRNAQTTADVIWEAYERTQGNKPGNTEQKRPAGEGEPFEDNPLRCSELR